MRLSRRSKRYSYVAAELFQGAQSLVQTQAIYTTFPPLPTTHASFSPTNQYLVPLTPSSYAPISPLLTHPSIVDPSTTLSNEVGRRWSTNSIFNFLQHLKWNEDAGIKKRREEKDAKVIEWGAWCEFKAEGERLTSESMPFFADVFSSIPELFPDNQKVAPTWFPTMSMSIQFFASIPVNAPYLFAPQTVGLYTTGKWIRERMHQQNVEVWASPSPIGLGEREEDWRKRSMILCTSSQLALLVTVPEAGSEGAEREGGEAVEVRAAMRVIWLDSTSVADTHEPVSIREALSNNLS